MKDQIKLFLKRRLPNKEITLSEHFINVFKKNAWQSSESFSGLGSTLDQTLELRLGLHSAIKQLNVKNVIDIPCGDSNWMRHEKFYNLKYLGIDIVPQVIQQNVMRNQNYPLIDFQVGDFTSFRNFPQTDLVITRDLFVHLNYSDIAKCLRTFIDSGSKYLGVTTFRKVPSNTDLEYPASIQQIIGWRPINVAIAPFNLKDPIFSIDEKCTERDGSRVFDDKYFEIFEAESIKLSLICLNDYLKKK